jgi:hypothetical protein
MHLVPKKFCSHSRIPSLPISCCCLGGGSEDHQPGGYLHAGGLQHAPPRHHLQQLHRCTPSGRPLIFFFSHFLLQLTWLMTVSFLPFFSGQVLLREQQASHPLLHVRGLWQDHRQLPPQRPPAPQGDVIFLSTHSTPSKVSFCPRLSDRSFSFGFHRSVIKQKGLRIRCKLCCLTIIIVPVLYSTALL